MPQSFPGEFEMTELKIDEIGLKVGLEIHQQLDTRKLFCKCESNLDNDRNDKKYRRRLSLTLRKHQPSK